MCFFFFFSSRRRHTRFDCDWSSDVCSSDLGGLIRDRVYLLAGPAGAGKTIFSTQFLYNGISKYNENGVYVVLEETPQQLRENVYNSFGWNIQTYEDNGNIVVLDAISSRLGLSSAERFVVPRPFTLESLLYEIQNAIQTVYARR